MSNLPTEEVTLGYTEVEWTHLQPLRGFGAFSVRKRPGRSK